MQTMRGNKLLTVVHCKNCFEHSRDFNVCDECKTKIPADAERFNVARLKLKEISKLGCERKVFTAPSGVEKIIFRLPPDTSCSSDIEKLMDDPSNPISLKTGDHKAKTICHTVSSYVKESGDGKSVASTSKVLPGEHQKKLEAEEKTVHPLYCRSIRIGSYLIHNPTNSRYQIVLLQNDSIILKAPELTESKKLVLITLQNEDIKRVFFHHTPYLSAMFVHTTEEFAASVRNDLHMVPNTPIYFDSIVRKEGDNTQLLIIFIIEKLTEQQSNLICEVFPGEKKVVKVNKATANIILLRSTQKMVEKEHNNQVEDNDVKMIPAEEKVVKKKQSSQVENEEAETISVVEKEVVKKKPTTQVKNKEAKMISAVEEKVVKKKQSNQVEKMVLEMIQAVEKELVKNKQTNQEKDEDKTISVHREEVVKNKQINQEKDEDITISVHREEVVENKPTKQEEVEDNAISEHRKEVVENKQTNKMKDEDVTMISVHREEVVENKPTKQEEVEDNAISEHRKEVVENKPTKQEKVEDNAISEHRKELVKTKQTNQVKDDNITMNSVHREDSLKRKINNLMEDEEMVNKKRIKKEEDEEVKMVPVVEQDLGKKGINDLKDEKEEIILMEEVEEDVGKKEINGLEDEKEEIILMEEVEEDVGKKEINGLEDEKEEIILMEEVEEDVGKKEINGLEDEEKEIILMEEVEEGLGKKEINDLEEEKEEIILMEEIEEDLGKKEINDLEEEKEEIILMEEIEEDLSKKEINDLEDKKEEIILMEEVEEVLGKKEINDLEDEKEVIILMEEVEKAVGKKEINDLEDEKEEIILMDEEEETNQVKDDDVEIILSEEECLVVEIPVVKLFTYPPPPQTGGISVTNEDLDCLNEGEFLNDVIIDFYLKYVFREKLSPAIQNKTHIFSSFFYSRLTQEPKNLPGDDPIKMTPFERHKPVKTWTRHVNIFSKDYIVVPVNEGAHWALAIICFPNRVENAPSTNEKEENTTSENISQDYSSMTSPLNSSHMVEELINLDNNSKNPESSPPDEQESDEMPCICVFDSLSGQYIDYKKLVTVLREYLEIEWKCKKGTQNVFDENSIPGILMKCPQQTNLDDCGLYLLQFAESFFENPFQFGNPLPDLENWFPETKIAKKREELKCLLLKLEKEQANTCNLKQKQATTGCKIGEEQNQASINTQ